MCRNQYKRTTHKIKNTKIDQPKFVSLPKISQNLILGNIDFANNETLVKQHNINVIINCSNEQICSMSNIRIYNIEYEDTKIISYDTFMSIIKYTTGIIESFKNSEGNILVVCNKGVNRSASIVAAYGILHSDEFKNASDVINYIDSEKLKVDKNWNNFTNQRIKNLLLSLSS